MTKSIKITIASFLCLMLFAFGFMFSSCGNPTPVNVTDDGTLDHDATEYLKTDTLYTMEDFNAILGSQTTDSFAGFDGFRFTFVSIKTVDDVVTIKQVNGLTTNEGMNFQISQNTAGSLVRNDVITIKDQKVYSRINDVDDATKDAEKTYTQTNETKFVILKNYLSDCGFLNLFVSPKDILNNLSGENVSANIIRHEEVFMLSVFEDEVLTGIVYANFDAQNNLTALKYQNQTGTEMVTISGFNGTIAFPDLGEYEQEVA